MFFTGLRTRIAALERNIAQLHQHVIELNKRIDASSNAQLRAECDALNGTLQSVIASNRKEFGKLWGRVGVTHSGASNGEAGDEDFEQLLQLQRASNGS